MNALSIRQPWAWAIFHAGKDIENRQWPTRFRGRILIHAGKQWHPNGFDILKDRGVDVPLEELHRGGVIGSVEIVDCVTFHPSDWFFGPYGFVLHSPEICDFSPVRGRLGFFPVVLEAEGA